MAPAATRGIYSAADLHTHTCHSDGRPTPRELLEKVAADGHLQIIAVTDHNTIEGALEAADLAPTYGLICVVGEEVSSSAGHILGLFLADAVPPALSPEETIAAIHKQGGLAVAPHPFYHPRRPQPVPELPTMESVGELIATLPFDAVETINATPFLSGANREAQRYNRAHANRPELASSDAHILDAVGKGYTVFPGETAGDLRRAILAGETVALQQRYAVGELIAYLQFWVRTSVARGGPAW